MLKPVNQVSVGVLSYRTFEFDGASNSTNNFDLGVDFRDISLSLVYKF